jgi:putative ABC transport system permease protein
MGLGILLLRKSGKQGSFKFVITMTAAALGTLILLFVFSITNAVNSSNHRITWENAIVNNGGTADSSNLDTLEKPNGVIYLPDDFVMPKTFLDKNVKSYSMHFNGGILPKGSPLDTYPKAGEYYISQALADLMNKYSNDVLRDRFPGKQVGIIPNRALSSPDELAIIKGVNLSAFDDPSSTDLANAIRISDFTVSGYGVEYQERAETILTSAMAMGAIGLIIPVMMLIATATTLGARERENRYAALRLIGATKRQIRSITLIDSLAASIAGVGIGAVIYLFIRPILFNARVAGLRFFPEDISVSPLIFGIIIAITVTIVWLANAIAMRKSITSPLGVARKQKLTKSPRIWSVIPLLLCIAGLTFLNSFNRDTANISFGTMLPFYMLLLFMLTMLSLLLAGSWLTKLYGKLIYRFNKRSDGLLVSRRIKYEARTIFRGIGGIVIAFFAGAFFITSLTTLTNLADANTPLIQKITPDNSIQAIGVEGSEGLKQLQKQMNKSDVYQTEPITIYSLDQNSLISCKDAQKLFNKTCNDASKYVIVPTYSSDNTLDMTKLTDKANFPSSNTDYVEYIYLPKDTSATTLIEAEKIVTANAKSGNTAIVAVVNTALRTAVTNSYVASFKSLLYAGIILTIIVASMNLVVATVAGLFDRKGSFFTLRLSGAEIPFLKRIVTSESMLPLVFISLVSIASGIYAAYVFLRLSSGTLAEAFVLPEPFFWLCVVTVFVFSYVGMKLILPMLDKLTNIEENRTE